MMDELLVDPATGESTSFEECLRSSINEGVATIAALASTDQKGVTPERLSKIWRISLMRMLREPLIKLRSLADIAI